jgi:hypothetical protein
VVEAAASLGKTAAYESSRTSEERGDTQRRVGPHNERLSPTVGPITGLAVDAGRAPVRPAG